MTLLITAPPCLACSCVESSDAEKFENASAVFTGEVTDVEDAQPGPDGGDRLSWRVDVESVEKGGAAPIEHVLTGGAGDTCSPGIEVGKRFQVYASRNSDGRLETNLCAGTHELDGDDDPVVVAPTRPPVKTPASTPTLEPRRGALPERSGETVARGEQAPQTPGANPLVAAAAVDESDGANSPRDWTITFLVWALLALPVVLLTGRRKRPVRDA
ncbi:MAG: hypothetical protein WD826_02870 [Actinomycetota bacterium]